MAGKSLTDKVVEKIVLTLVGEGVRKFSKDAVASLSEKLKPSNAKKSRKLKKTDLDTEEDSLG